jgi:hypothetical protein
VITPVDPQPGTEPGPEYSDGLGSRTRWGLWITITIAVTVAATHQTLTAALASAHRDALLKAAHAALAWPMPAAQPVAAGVAAFVLLGFAVQTAGWRSVSARQLRLVIGFGVVAALAAGPMVLFVGLTVLACLLVIAIGLASLFLLFMLLVLAR